MPTPRTRIQRKSKPTQRQVSLAPDRWILFSRQGPGPELTVVDGVATLKTRSPTLTKNTACLKQRFPLKDGLRITSMWQVTLSEHDRYASISTRFYGLDGKLVSGTAQDRPFQLAKTARQSVPWGLLDVSMPTPTGATSVELCLELKAQRASMVVSELKIGTGGTSAAAQPGSDAVSDGGEPKPPCWDRDGDGEADPDEDINSDGRLDAADCLGAGESDSGGRGSDGSSGVYLGNLSIGSHREAEHFCDYYDTIFGNLSISGEYEETLAALGCLVEVTQNLFIHNQNLTDCSLPQLSNVGASLHLNGSLCEEAHFPRLAGVGETLELQFVGRDSSVPTRISFPVLSQVGQRLELVSSNALEVDFSSLETIGDGLYISGHFQLANLDGFSALSEVGQDLVIRGNPGLLDLSGLSSLTSVGQDVEIVGDESLPRHAAEALAAEIDHIGGVVSISERGPE